MELKKNQEILLVPSKTSREDGEGLGKYQGFPLFVKDTVIGDKVKVLRHETEERTMATPVWQRFMEPSPDRVDPALPGGKAVRRLQDSAALIRKTEGVQMEPGGKLPETHRWI